MSGVQPTLIDYQGITINNSTLEKNATLTMNGTSQGLILQYDKLTANPKQFTITHNGINYTDNTNNDTTGLQRLTQVQELFQAVEVPPDANTLQINNKLTVTDATNNKGSMSVDATGNMIIDASNNLYFTQFGTLELPIGVTLDMSGGSIVCGTVTSVNNTNIFMSGTGTGDIILKTGDIDRLNIADDGYWSCEGGMQYDNLRNILYAGTFIGAGINMATATQIRPRNRDVNADLYPLFVSGTGNSSFNIDSVTGPLTYNPFTGTMNFPGVPTCTTSGTTSAQLTNFQQFGVVTSWLPTLSSSGGGTPTYIFGTANTTGRYVLIGKLCIFHAELRISAFNTLAVGELSVSLPFTCSSTAPASFNMSLMNGVNSSPAVIDYKLTADAGSSSAKFLARDTTTSTNYRALTRADIQVVFRPRYAGSYIIA